MTTDAPTPGSAVSFAGTEYPVIAELNGGFALIAHPNGPAICGHGWLSTLHQHDDDTARVKELARLATEKFVAWAWVRLKGTFYPPTTDYQAVDGICLLDEADPLVRAINQLLCCKNAIGVSAVQIVEVVERELKKTWENASTLRYHVLRYGPAGYDITRGWNAVDMLGVDGEGVLVTDGNEYAVASRHCDEWFECATERPLAFAPTHWMDLPDFPSESNTAVSQSATSVESQKPSRQSGG